MGGINNTGVKFGMVLLEYNKQCPSANADIIFVNNKLSGMGCYCVSVQLMDRRRKQPKQYNLWLMIKLG